MQHTGRRVNTFWSLQVRGVKLSGSTFVFAAEKRRLCSSVCLLFDCSSDSLAARRAVMFSIFTNLFEF